ncbi:MAG: DUF6399 domain-containing protein [Oculatellaceae cyanobacterium Prado106]|nr:DUF6399 domain-containing protein [Oculatellaceae cyanobacterium Prado106]
MLKRSDGTTPAQRLFAHSFPDLFQWVLSQMGDLPMPRLSSKAHPPQSLRSHHFPA